MSDYDPTDLERQENQEEDAARAKLLDELTDAHKLASLQRLLQSQEFRDWAWDFIAWTKMLGEPFDPNFGRSGYNMGRASAGRKLMGDVCLADPSAWRSMMDKANERAAAVAAEEQRKALERRARRS